MTELYCKVFLIKDRSLYLIVLSVRNVLLYSPGPIHVQGVLVKGQHEHDQHEESIEDREEENRLVPQLFQSGGGFGLKRRRNIIIIIIPVIF